MAKQEKRPAPPVATRSCWLQLRLECAAFHDELPPPARSWCPTIALPAPLLVQLLHVVFAALPSSVRPCESDPVRMSCWFGVSPRPFTGSPFSLSANSLLMLLRSRCRSPCRSLTFLAISAPFALYQGPVPMRSRAFAAG